MTEKKKNKTWSRELATLLLLFVCYVAFNGSIDILEIIVWPFVAFAMAAFGFKQEVVKDFASK